MRAWDNFTNQHQWREYITNLIKTNDIALCRSILIIYSLQTQEEKSIRETTVHNGVGFGSIDADFMTSVAELILQGKVLTPQQVAVARNKMPKYWKQLMRVTQGELKVDIQKTWRKDNETIESISRGINTSGTNRHPA